MDIKQTSGQAFRRRLYPWVVLLLVGVVLQLPGILRSPNPYDEGLILAGADRILQGEVPYRDFWNTHPPAQIWVVAALFRLFGPSMLLMRLYDVLLRSALAVLMVAYARRLVPGRIGWLVFAMAILWLLYPCSFGYTVVPALLFGHLSLFLLARGMEQGATWRTQLVAGVLAGGAALFRADFGAYACIAALALMVLGHATTPGVTGRARARALFREGLLFAAGLLLVTVPALLVLLAQGVSLTRLAEVLIIYPVTVFPHVRAQPVPPWQWLSLAHHVPLWICGVGLLTGAVVRLRRRSGQGAGHGLTWWALASFPLLTLPHIHTRADLAHQVPAILPALPLACALWVGAWRHGRRVRRGLCVLGIPLLLLTFLTVPLRYWLPVVRHPWATAAVRDLPRARGIALDADLARAVRHIQAHTRPEDYLYVGTGRHDAIEANDALFYFLAARRYACPYHNLLPGLATREDTQRDIVSDLTRYQVQRLVLFSTFDARAGQRMTEKGSTVLDQWIAIHYSPDARWGPYQVLRRR